MGYSQRSSFSLAYSFASVAAFSSGGISGTSPPTPLLAGEELGVRFSLLEKYCVAK